MLKASWGGGGKGIRKVQSDEDVRAVFKQIQGEVRRRRRGAFLGGGRGGCGVQGSRTPYAPATRPGPVPAVTSAD
jgi:hypothetical protein